MAISIILGSNHLERLEFAAMTAFLASTMGEDVEIFATMDAVKAFCKTPSVLCEAESAKRIAEKENGGKYVDYLKKAKNGGKLRLTACSMASSLFGLKKEDFTELVDGIGGLTSFLDSSEGRRLIDIW
ncbi:MAG: DsrE family protein [Thermoplasmata archaeon]|uniref:DsrE family protein n=1 Tax=Candidatus Sysuiplasma superficiale TaxID=2823368 RepID=A0A8J7YLA4_9ARCH|nr:DsrE family protein [Candidatus Sysuiplasma superficiale]MBX8644347.1 DsrE family protein [Candidatus Sysuiplasma superficiale]